MKPIEIFIYGVLSLVAVQVVAHFVIKKLDPEANNG